MSGQDILLMQLLCKAKIVLNNRLKSNRNNKSFNTILCMLGHSRFHERQLLVATCLIHDTYKSVSRLKRRNVPSAIVSRAL